MQNENKSEPEPSESPMSSNVMNNPADLLNDIELNLQVEIGRVKIKISDLLNLSDGSIIQLEQKPDEPLMIYANDKFVAKGNIISCNGQYKIRIL